MAKKKKQGIVNPTRLASFDKEKKVQVVIETPKGSRNKYAWDPDQQIFALEKSPAGRNGISARLWFHSFDGR